MANRFTNKLARFASLSDEDIAVLSAATARTRTVPARHDLSLEGDVPGPVFVILEGWACRYKILPEGGRQIMAFLMPGDTCDIQIGSLEVMDHSIKTLTPARIATISPREMHELLENRTPIALALIRTQLVDEATLRAWIVSMGRRDSLARVAHLMCELFIHARNVGLVEDGELVLPISQIAIADSLGLTPVHVNRVFRTLRKENAMRVDVGSLVIIDPARLAVLAGFDDTYLHRRLIRTVAAQ